MPYTVTTKKCWYNDYRTIVKMFFLNDVPFTFDDLPVGYFYDREIIEEADNNKEYSVEDIYKGSNYLIMEQCDPCFDDIEILNPENLPEEIQSFYNGEEDLRNKEWKLCDWTRHWSSNYYFYYLMDFTEYKWRYWAGST